MESLISRREAARQGLARYFTGEPCKYGHIAERCTANGACVPCHNLGEKKWRKANPGAHNERQAGYVRRHPDRAALVQRRAAQKKRGEPIEPMEKKPIQPIRKAPSAWDSWKARKPDLARALNFIASQNRRARKAAAGGAFCLSDLAFLQEAQAGRCAVCGKKMRVAEVDHIVPIARGGSSDRSNLQLLCRPCNRRKGAKDPIEWAQQRGQLL